MQTQLSAMVITNLPVKADWWGRMTKKTNKIEKKHNMKSELYRRPLPAIGTAPGEQHKGGNSVPGSWHKQKGTLESAVSNKSIHCSLSFYA